MKVKPLAKVATNPELERLISKKDEELKNSARKNGKHYASKNQPASKGDKLSPYIGDIKNGYEQLASEAHKHLQPGTHLPEGQLEAERVKQKGKGIEERIFQLEEQNKHDVYELQDHDSKSIRNRIFLALVLTAIILIGEVVFNAKAFEISGENMLFALIISFALSFAIYLFSHAVPVLYKEIESPFKRKVFVIGSIAIVSIAFIVLANLRSYLLSQHQVSISPIFFIILNLFLFIVSALISYYLFPTWEEIKGSYHNEKLHKGINKRVKEIEALNKQLEEIKNYITELAQQIVRINYYVENTNRRIEKMYSETVGIFISVNIATRSDRTVPDCFHEELPVGDFGHLTNLPNLKANNEQ